MGTTQPTFGDLFSAAKTLPGAVSVQVDAARFSSGDEVLWKLYYADGAQKLYTASTAAGLLAIIDALCAERSVRGLVDAQIAAVRL